MHRHRASGLRAHGERTYTEAELRTRLFERRDELVRALSGRLGDDGYFDDLCLPGELTIGPDGSYVADWEPLRAELLRRQTLLINELLSSMLVAMFDEPGVV